MNDLFTCGWDDFLWSGTKDFRQTVINKVTSTFQSGKQDEGNFQYVELDIKHLEEGIVLDQQPYIEGMDYVKISPARSGRKYDSLNQEEISVLRGMIGQANWAASQSRPDASFDVTDLSINMKHPQVKHLLEANKLIRKLKSEYCGLVFPRSGDLRNLRLFTFSDASYANISDGVSSVGSQIVLLVGENQSSCPLAWSVNKIK